MQSWVMVALATVYPTDSLSIVFIIASIGRMVRMQADDTGICLDHHPRFTFHVLHHVFGAVTQAVFQVFTWLATPSTAACTSDKSGSLTARTVCSAEMIGLNLLA